jgi:hypothetical protein
MFFSSHSDLDNFSLQVLSYDFVQRYPSFGDNDPLECLEEMDDIELKNLGIVIDVDAINNQTFSGLQELRAHDALFRCFGGLSGDNAKAVDSLSKDCVHLCPLIVTKKQDAKEVPIVRIGKVYLEQMLISVGRRIAVDCFEETKNVNGFEWVNRWDAETDQIATTVFDISHDHCDIMYSEKEGTTTGLHELSAEGVSLATTGSMELAFSTCPSIITLFSRRTFLWVEVNLDINSNFLVRMMKPSLLCQPKVNVRDFGKQNTDDQDYFSLSIREGKYSVGQSENSLMNTALGYVGNEINFSTTAFYSMPFDCWKKGERDYNLYQERAENKLNKESGNYDVSNDLKIKRKVEKYFDNGSKNSIVLPLEKLYPDDSEILKSTQYTSTALSDSEIKEAFVDLFGMDAEYVSKNYVPKTINLEKTRSTHVATYLLYVLMALVKHEYNSLRTKNSWIQLLKKLLSILELRVSKLKHKDLVCLIPFSNNIAKLLWPLSFSELRFKVLFIWSVLLYPKMSLVSVDGAGRVGNLAYAMIRCNMPRTCFDTTSKKVFATLTDRLPVPNSITHMMLLGKTCQFKLYSSGTASFFNLEFLRDIVKRSTVEQQSAMLGRQLTINDGLRKLTRNIRTAVMSTDPIMRAKFGIERFLSPDYSDEKALRNSLFQNLELKGNQASKVVEYFVRFKSSEFTPDSTKFHWADLMDFMDKTEKTPGQMDHYYGGSVARRNDGNRLPLPYEDLVPTLKRTSPGLSLPEIMTFYSSTACYIYALFFACTDDEMEATMQSIHIANPAMKQHSFTDCAKLIRQSHALVGTQWISHCFGKAGNYCFKEGIYENNSVMPPGITKMCIVLAACCIEEVHLDISTTPNTDENFWKRHLWTQEIKASTSDEEHCSLLDKFELLIRYNGVGSNPNNGEELSNGEYTRPNFISDELIVRPLYLKKYKGQAQTSFDFKVCVDFIFFYFFFSTKHPHRSNVFFLDFLSLYTNSRSVSIFFFISFFFDSKHSLFFFFPLSRTGRYVSIFFI